jgi:hypothetical protein
VAAGVNRSPDDALDELVHRADLDGLVRLIDARCESRDWAGLRRTRDRARQAVATGRQLWPAATLAEYRLALLAPADWAAGVIDEESGRFTIGPLSEVVAQHHSWADLGARLAPGPRALYVAHERAIRSETIDPESIRDLPPVLDIPAALQSWEPQYPTAVYHDSHAEFPAPPGPAGFDTVATRGSIDRLDDDTTELAVRQLVEAWTTSSNGSAEVMCVQGDHVDALGALGIEQARVARLTAAEALAWLGWAGASGGAHGRRRGAAIGRYGAWWVLGALGQLHDDWPPSPSHVEELLDDLRWWWWEADVPVTGWPATGWSLRLVVEDATDGVAWAINARDAV